MDHLSAAKTWLEQDPDPVTKQELEKLIQSQNLEELAARFSSRLEFGTAGLRGELGAGPNRMNQIVVAQTAFGHCKVFEKERVFLFGCRRPTKCRHWL